MTTRVQNEQRRKEAFRLRRQNHSYNAINRLLGIPKSTLSNWLKADRQSAMVKKKLIVRAQHRAARALRIMARANKEKWAKIHTQYRVQARREYATMRSWPLFIAGTVIYWGEGDKRLSNSIVRVPNTDPRLLSLFVSFLQHCCKVSPEKIRAWVLLYPDLDERICQRYWAKAIHLPRAQFVKPQIIDGRSKKRKLTYGVCTVQVYSREVKEKILEWIDLSSQIH